MLYTGYVGRKEEVSDKLRKEYMEEKRMETMETMKCPICGKIILRKNAIMTHDCYGIPYRLVCPDCWEKIMNGRGYDGEYYTEADEYLDDDY
jgi:predicted RNA-binding Zn-ribbon protein involved in translation (DUF1610 family)